MTQWLTATYPRVEIRSSNISGRYHGIFHLIVIWCGPKNELTVPCRIPSQRVISEHNTCIWKKIRSGDTTTVHSANAENGMNNLVAITACEFFPIQRWQNFLSEVCSSIRFGFSTENRVNGTRAFCSTSKRRIVYLAYNRLNGTTGRLRLTRQCENSRLKWV